MSTDTLRDDLDAAMRIAREGQNAPLLGGGIGLLWGLLAAVALVAHYAVIVGWVGIPPSMVGLVWAFYGLIGGVGSAILGRRLAARPGVRNFANKASEAAWFAGGVMVAVIAISLVIGYAVGATEIVDFNYIVPLAFLVSAVVNGMLARLLGHGYLVFAAVAAAFATVLTLLNVRVPEMYLLAAGLVVVSGVVPSIIELRRAR